MNLHKLFLRIFLSIVLLITFSITNIQAVEIEMISFPEAVNDFTPIGSINEATEYTTIKFSGLSNGVPIYYCLLSDQGDCDGDFSDYTPTDNTFTLEVCPRSDSALKEAKCTDTNSDYFEAQHTYRVGIYSTRSIFDWVSIAEIKTVHFYPEIKLVPDNLTIDTPFEVQVIGLRIPEDNNGRNDYSLQINGINSTATPNNDEFCNDDRSTPGVIKYTHDRLFSGEYELIVSEKETGGGTCSGSGFSFTKIIFTVGTDTDPGEISEIIYNPNHEDGLGQWDENGAGSLENEGTGEPGINPCAGGTCRTAIGDFPTEIGAFASKFLSIAIGLAGGIAFILLVIGSIRVLISSGDPKAVAGGRDMIIAAIAGLLFLIFSAIILRFIGVTILGGLI